MARAALLAALACASGAATDQHDGRALQAWASLLTTGSSTTGSVTPAAPLWFKLELPVSQVGRFSASDVMGVADIDVYVTFSQPSSSGYGGPWAVSDASVSTSATVDINYPGPTGITFDSTGQLWYAWAQVAKAVGSSASTVTVRLSSLAPASPTPSFTPSRTPSRTGTASRTPSRATTRTPSPTPSPYPLQPLATTWTGWSTVTSLPALGSRCIGVSFSSGCSSATVDVWQVTIAAPARALRFSVLSSLSESAMGVAVTNYLPWPSPYGTADDMRNAALPGLTRYTAPVSGSGTYGLNISVIIDRADLYAPVASGRDTQFNFYVAVYTRPEQLASPANFPTMGEYWAASSALSPGGAGLNYAFTADALPQAISAATVSPGSGSASGSGSAGYQNDGINMVGLIAIPIALVAVGVVCYKRARAMARARQQQVLSSAPGPAEASAAAGSGGVPVPMPMIMPMPAPAGPYGYPGGGAGAAAVQQAQLAQLQQAQMAQLAALQAQGQGRGQGQGYPGQPSAGSPAGGAAPGFGYPASVSPAGYPAGYPAAPAGYPAAAPYGYAAYPQAGAQGTWMQQPGGYFPGAPGATGTQVRMAPAPVPAAAAVANTAAGPLGEDAMSPSAPPAPADDALPTAPPAYPAAGDENPTSEVVQTPMPDKAGPGGATAGYV